MHSASDEGVDSTTCMNQLTQKLGSGEMKVAEVPAESSTFRRAGRCSNVVRHPYKAAELSSPPLGLYGPGISEYNCGMVLTVPQYR